MTAKPEDFLLQAWKQQLDLGLRLAGTIVGGAIKLQSDWTRANAEKCAAYWRELQKFHCIPIGSLPEGHVGAQPAPARRKPSRRAHAAAAQ